MDYVVADTVDTPKTLKKEKPQTLYVRPVILDSAD